jgi:hypothetical protein
MSKTQLWSLPRGWLDDQDRESLAALDTGNIGGNAGRPYTPLEEKTAMVLDQIFPRSVEAEIDEQIELGESNRKATSPLKKQNACAHASSASMMPGKDAVATPFKKNRLLRLRQNILERFSSLKIAFDTFAGNSCTYEKELTGKKFLHILGKHFPSFRREEQERIYEILTADRSRPLSLCSLHTAIEFAMPVQNVEDLRKRWIAFGFPSMRQGIAAMDSQWQQNNTTTAEKRFAYSDFAEAMCRTGVTREEEHRSLFSLLTDATGASTVSLDELSSALASVSPSLLLEDLRDRLLKRYGTLHNAYRTMSCDEHGRLYSRGFVQHSVANMKLSVFEARKAFGLMDVDGNGHISQAEFMAALRLSESGLFLEDVRRKVRQRYRSIRQAFGFEERNVQDVASVLRRTSHDDSMCQANAFLHASVVYKDAETKTLQEFCSILSAVQLLDADTKMLFELIDVEGTGKLTPIEFVRALRFFVPSCLLEELRLHCVSKFACARDAFLDALSDVECCENQDGGNQTAALFDFMQFQQFLEDRELDSGIDVQAIFNLIENRRDGGIRMGEVVVAMQSAAPGLQVPLPASQLDAKAKQQVRGHLAPFHRSALEVRLKVRQNFSQANREDEYVSGWNLPENRGTWSSPSRKKQLVDLQRTSHSLSPDGPSGKNAANGQLPFGKQELLMSLASPPSLTSAELQKSLLTRSASHGLMVHPPTRLSHKKVTHLLESRPPSVFNRKDGEGDPILERIHDYYASACDTMSFDAQLLKSPPRHLQPQVDPKVAPQLLKSPPRHQSHVDIPQQRPRTVPN